MSLFRSLFTKEGSTPSSKILSNKDIDEIIKNSDPKSRCNLVKTVSNPDLLLYFYNNENDQIVIQSIENQIISEFSKIEDSSNLDSINSATYSDFVARSLAISSRSDALSQLMLDRLTNDISIYEVVDKASNNETKKSAIQKLNDISLLKNIVHNYKGRQKIIYRSAKDKLEELILQKKQTEYFDNTLVQANEYIQQNNITESMLIKLKQIGKDYADISQSQKNKYDEILSKAKKLYSFIKSAQESRQKICDEVGLLADNIQSMTNELSQKEFNNQLISLQKEWVDLDDWDNPEAKALMFRFEEQINRANKLSNQFYLRQHQIDKYQSILDKIQNRLDSSQMIKESDISSFKQRWARLKPINDNQLKNNFEKEFREKINLLESKLKYLGNIQEENYLKIIKYIQILDESLKIGLTKKAFQANQSIKKIFDSDVGISSSVYKKIIELYNPLENQIQELHSWQKFGSDQVREEIIQEMQILSDSQNLDMDEKIEEIKQLHKKWKSLSGRPAEKIYKKFKKISDQAWVPCDIFLKEKQKNNKIKQQKIKDLLDKWDSKIDTLDWGNPDWLEINSLYQAFDKEWGNNVSSIDYKPHQLYKKYHQVDKKWQKYLDPERQREEKCRKNLIIKAQELLNIDDQNERIKKIKQLQSEWKPNIRLKDKKKEDILWREFKQICDQIFSKSREEQKQHELGLNKKVKDYQDKITTLTNNIAQAKDIVSLRKLYSDTEIEFKKYSDMGSYQNRINQLFYDAEKIYKQKLDSFIALKRAEQLSILEEKDQICLELETLDNTSDIILVAKNKWEQLNNHDVEGDYDKNITDMLNKRFENATNKKIINQDYVTSSLQNILITFEIILDIDTPKEFTKQRNNLQVNYLKDAMHGEKILEKYKTAKGLYELQCKWYCLAKPVDKAVKLELVSRFNKIKSILDAS